MSAPATSIPLLPYQQKIVTQLLEHEESCCVIAGLGLGRLRIFESLLEQKLKAFDAALTAQSSPKPLVFVLNLSREDAEGLRSRLTVGRMRKDNVHVFSAGDTSVSARGPAMREQCYARGGICFVSIRLLLGDFLQRRFDGRAVQTLLVDRAEEVYDVLQKEAFVVQALLRKVAHPDRAVRLFTEDFATAASKGLEKIMRCGGYCRKAFLWPRIQQDVSLALATRQDGIVLASERNGATRTRPAGVEGCRNSPRKSPKPENEALSWDSIALVEKRVPLPDRIAALQQSLLAICEDEVCRRLCAYPDCLRALEAEWRGAANGAKMMDLSSSFSSTTTSSGQGCLATATGFKNGNGLNKNYNYAGKGVGTKKAYPNRQTKGGKNAAIPAELLSHLCSDAIADQNFGRKLRYQLDTCLDDGQVARLVREAGQFATLFERLLKLDCADYFRFVGLFLGQKSVARMCGGIAQAEADKMEEQAAAAAAALATQAEEHRLNQVEAAVVEARVDTDVGVADLDGSNRKVPQSPEGASKDAAVGNKKGKAKAKTKAKAAKAKAVKAKAATAASTAKSLLGASGQQEETFSSMPTFAAGSEVSWLQSDAGRGFLRLARARVLARERNPKWDTVLEILTVEGVLSTDEHDLGKSSPRENTLDEDLGPPSGLTSPPAKRRKVERGESAKNVNKSNIKFVKKAVVVCADDREKQQLRTVLDAGTEAAIRESLRFLSPPKEDEAMTRLVVDASCTKAGATSLQEHASESFSPGAAAPSTSGSNKPVAVVNVEVATANEVEASLYQFLPDVIIVMSPDVRVMRIVEVYAASVRTVRAKGETLWTKEDFLRENAKMNGTAGKINEDVGNISNDTVLTSSKAGDVGTMMTKAVLPSMLYAPSPSDTNVDGTNPEIGEAEGVMVSADKTILVRNHGFQGTSWENSGISVSLRCFLLSFQDSIETAKYQQTLAAETKGVELAVFQKKRLVVDLSTATTETLAQRPILQIEDLEEAKQSTRLGGGRHQRQSSESYVIVDVRELNARLPFFLYQRHTLLPATIKIGDYILSRDVCVERKSVYPDLIESLKSGRLLQQAENLVRAYKTPILLLEFGPSVARRFPQWAHLAEFGGGTAGGGGGFASSGSKQAQMNGAALLRQKLILLMLQFPTLRVIWSPSYAYTARIFKALKKNRLEPNLPRDAAGPSNAFFMRAPGLTAENLRLRGNGVMMSGSTSNTNLHSYQNVQTSSSGDATCEADQVLSENRVANPAALDVLRSLPGVTGANLARIAARLPNLAAIAKMSKEELKGLLLDSAQDPDGSVERTYRILHGRSTNSAPEGGT
ncbi:unnamed protein product [Amoebophrya sp. A25]|nr:unnamed protein product [Amoebophrya sp. A25]|eukprot:GSA25T00011655001.1